MVEKLSETTITAHFYKLILNVHKHVVTMKTKTLMNKTNRPENEAARSCVKLCYRTEQNIWLGLTASLLAGRAAKCLLPAQPPLKARQ